VTLFFIEIAWTSGDSEIIKWVFTFLLLKLYFRGSSHVLGEQGGRLWKKDRDAALFER
jgi:hypothetical protein